MRLGYTRLRPKRPKRERQQGDVKMETFTLLLNNHSHHG